LNAFFSLSHLKSPLLILFPQPSPCIGFNLTQKAKKIFHLNFFEIKKLFKLLKLKRLKPKTLKSIF